MLVLSLFPGIGMLDQAFEAEGFCVVRGPDVLWGGDIRKFHPPAGRFDGVIGGPPCQAFSSLAHMVRHNGYETEFGNLIPEFERCVTEAGPTWWLMENVKAAPLPFTALIPRVLYHGESAVYGVHSFLLNNRQLGEKQNRLRRWTFGHIHPPSWLRVETQVFEPIEYETAALGGSGGCARPIKIGGSGKVKTTMPLNNRGAKGFAELCRKQGLPEGFDIPPFTVAAKCKAVGNGVPLAMGRAIAKAVRLAVTTKGS